ncbi:MAG: hypothetical protein V2A73_00720 [Pseudomonadota bacterium]
MIRRHIAAAASGRNAQLTPGIVAGPQEKVAAKGGDGLPIEGMPAAPESMDKTKDDGRGTRDRGGAKAALEAVTAMGAMETGVAATGVAATEVAVATAEPATSRVDPAMKMVEGRQATAGGGSVARGKARALKATAR